jgi:hypothetical protein
MRRTIFHRSAILRCRPAPGRPDDREAIDHGASSGSSAPAILVVAAGREH